jgi:hypothetical protein
MKGTLLREALGGKKVKKGGSAAAKLLIDFD